MRKSPIEPMEAEHVDEYLAEIIGWLPDLMRQVLRRSLAILLWLAVFNVSPTSAVTKPDTSDEPNFSGTWKLDLEASTSLDPMMDQIGASFFDRKYAGWISLRATLQQTEDVLTVATRGPGFVLDQTLYLDGHNDQRSLEILGVTSLNAKTVWSKDDKQLVETHQIRTKQGKDGQLIIRRSLMDEGKTLVVTFNLKLNAEPNQTSARQIWHKEA
jgi:hypothetical protein